MNGAIYRLGHALAWLGAMFMIAELAIASGVYHPGQYVFVVLGVLLMLTVALLPWIRMAIDE